MTGCRSDDWTRMERRARAWSRRLERDVTRMGEEIGREASATADAVAWSWSEDRAERRARKAERRAERRADRSAGRAERRRCGGSLWAYWWVAFPVFFLGRKLIQEAGGLEGMSAGAQGVAGGLADLTLAGQLADMVARLLGVAPAEAYGLLALSAAACAVAAVVGLRAGAPRALDLER
jgi:hypothetical protein